MNRNIPPLADTYVEPKVVEIGDAIFIDAPIMTQSGSPFDARQHQLIFNAVADEFIWGDVEITTPYSGSARILVGSKETSLADKPCKVRWQLKLSHDGNRYAVAHGVIKLMRPIRGMNDGS